MKCLFVGYATVDTIQGTRFPGGAAAALALNATHFSIESHLLTVLSQDPLGTWYKKILEKNGVTTSQCVFDAPSIPTCEIPATLTKDSQRIWKDNGALPFYQKLSVTTKYIQQFDLIFIVNAPPASIEVIFPYLESRTVIYIPGPQIITHPEYIRPQLIEKSIMVFANEEEWPILQHYQAQLQSVPIVVATKGSQGGLVFQPGKPVNKYSVPHQDVKDTTGAGDNFALHFARSYNSTKSVEQAIVIAIKEVSIILANIGNVHPSVLV